MTMNRAAFMTGLRKMELREVPMPVPKEDQVLVRLDYVGICGSDVHYYEHGRIGDFVVEGDFILGHECAGEVVQVGAEVQTLLVGDRVALEPGITCGQCVYCKTGRYNLCPDVEFLATPPYHGCLQTYLAYPANMAFRLPETISSREGALIEPLAVGLEVAGQGGVTLGSSVVILGAGCIGLTTLLAAKAFGATDITVVDILENRLNKALELGASRVFHGARPGLAEEIRESTAGGAEVVIETAGSSVTTRLTPSLIKRGGTIVLVGMAPEDTCAFDFSKLMGNVGQLKTIFRYQNRYPTAIQAVAGGGIDLSGIISREYGLDQVRAAFDANIEEKEELVKVVIKMQPE